MFACRVLEGKVQELQRDGLTVVDDVLSPEEIRGAREALDCVFARGHNPSLDAPGYSIDSGAAGEPLLALPDGSRFATNLLSKHPRFVGWINREPVLSLVRCLIADPLLSSLNALEPVRGSGRQKLHRDEGPVGAEGVVTLNTLWALDDMDRGNGATRYVPGTFLTSELADDDDPRVRYVSVRAGSVVVMNAHMLHGASLNLDGRRRRVVHVYYTRQGRVAQTPWTKYVPTSVRQSLSAQQSELLGL